MRKLIGFSLLLTLLLALVPGIAAQDDMDDDMMMAGFDVIVTLTPTPLAENLGLQDLSGWAHAISDNGSVHINIDHNGVTLPEGTVLEGWLVDAGTDGGPGGAEASSVSDADEAFGTGFGNEEFITAVEAAPYALSTGGLVDNGEGAWELIFEIPNYYLAPYDAVVITAESDGNSLDGFDPRPGTPVFVGLIAEGEAPDGMMMDDDMDDMDDMSEDMDDMGDDEMMDDDMMAEAVEVTLGTTPLAEGAGLADVTGTALVYSDSATVEITIELNGAELPEGAVLEGWVVDAGLLGGPGETSVSDLDEEFGTPFGNADFDALVESAPYALSTGNLADDMGTLTLTVTFPAYNFSPYDAVVITLESDGNGPDGFDPRPGTPVLSGPIGG